MNIANCQLPIADCRQPGGRRLARFGFPHRGPQDRPTGRGSNWQSAIGNRQSPGAFTLLELLVVVAIMAIVITMGVPFMRTAIDGGKGMTRAVKDIQEACSHARAIAILQQTTTELVIRPGDGVFEVGRSGSGTSPGYLQHERTTSEDENRPAVKAGGGGGGFSVKLPSGIVIEGLGVNGEDWTEDSVARVRFYPNGTSDEMSVVLLSDQNERRNLWLEVVTGLPELETDPHRFKSR